MPSYRRVTQWLRHGVLVTPSKYVAPSHTVVPGRLLSTSLRRTPCSHDAVFLPRSAARSYTSDAVLWVVSAAEVAPLGRGSLLRCGGGDGSRRSDIPAGPLGRL